jgi:hypothetical protein
MHVGFAQTTGNFGCFGFARGYALKIDTFDIVGDYIVESVRKWPLELPQHLRFSQITFQCK